MKAFTFSAILLLGLFAVVPLRTATAQNQYEEQVLFQLNEAAMAFTNEGYVPVLSEVDALDHGTTTSYTATLETGRSYALMGVCDQDCTDLDLALYDGYGNLVSRDQTDDDVPIVDVTVSQGGDFRLEVTMYQCSENPCYYGVGLYASGNADLNQYEEQVLFQLNEAAMAFTNEGYVPVLSEVDALDHGTTTSYTATLETGRTYALMGVCDQDCTDLDLALYDGYGNLVSRDQTNDDVPIVDVTVSQGGDFRLEVTMYQCSENPCYYGVGLYRD